MSRMAFVCFKNTSRGVSMRSLHLLAMWSTSWQGEHSSAHMADFRRVANRSLKTAVDLPRDCGRGI